MFVELYRDIMVLTKVGLDQARVSSLRFRHTCRSLVHDDAEISPFQQSGLEIKWFHRIGLHPQINHHWTTSAVKNTFLLSFIRELARFPLLKRAIPVYIVRLLLVLQIISLRVFKIVYYILWIRLSSCALELSQCCICAFELRIKLNSVFIQIITSYILLVQMRCDYPCGIYLT